MWPRQIISRDSRCWHRINIITFTSDIPLRNAFFVQGKCPRKAFGSCLLGQQLFHTPHLNRIKRVALRRPTHRALTNQCPLCCMSHLRWCEGRPLQLSLTGIDGHELGKLFWRIFVIYDLLEFYVILISEKGSGWRLLTHFVLRLRIGLFKNRYYRCVPGAYTAQHDQQNHRYTDDNAPNNSQCHELLCLVEGTGLPDIPEFEVTFFCHRGSLNRNKQIVREVHFDHSPFLGLNLLKYIRLVGASRHSIQLWVG